MLGIKHILRKLHWFSTSQLGIDVRRLFMSMRALPGFIKDWHQFRRGYRGCLTLMPCLHDRYEEGGTAKGEYFLQDLLVARMIYEAKPEIHVDVGSRIDGFVAHVASFRNIEVFDVRPITKSLPGVVFRQADFMRSFQCQTNGGYCDSLSCLHALEHFGLGRYNDPIDPEGHEKGIANMAQMLRPGGTLYLSIPIGYDRVEFNANRVFDPKNILRLAEINGLIFRRLVVVENGETIRDVSPDGDSLLLLAKAYCNLGIFVFTKCERI